MEWRTLLYSSSNCAWSGLARACTAGACRRVECRRRSQHPQTSSGPGRVFVALFVAKASRDLAEEAPSMPAAYKSTQANRPVVKLYLRSKHAPPDL